MLGHPALVFAEVGRDTQREAFLAEKHVSAISGVDGDNGIIFGEVHDISLFGIDVALAVEALDEIAVFAQLVEAHRADSGHDFHVENDVNGVGDLDTDLGEGGSDHAHGIRNDVHGSALHFAAGDLLHHFVGLIGRHPFYDGMRHGVLFLSAANERSVLDASDVVFGRSVQIAVGK